ncbi:phage portal protein [Streptomyces sp. MBT49]|uniref:phage portal protein n=1 Tax=Streptomyces sp. MBT49 TaxID=1488380 RepID=UPI00190B9909|nr:phage portal protein [Streptomyces sp. MBT49]MBK3625926.1 phage portal protein [Streptomyces sp. MBT49]
MSLFHRRDTPGQSADQVIPPRPGSSGGAVAVTQDSALRHSAVWACLRLRANLISTMPVDLYRKVYGIQVEVPKPAVLVTPGGDDVEMPEWMYSSEFDLDRSGNSIGLITARDGLNLPARIELVPSSDVTVRMRKGKKTYRIGGTTYQPEEVWHERQYTVPGLPVGLSPVAYAAWSISEYLSIQQFAMDWFSSGAIPSAHLKNTAKQLTPDQADGAKQRFKAAVMSRDLFVTGNDWDYEMIQAEQAGADWIAAKSFGIGDVARFFDCPADLIDAAVSGSAVTYANMTQRNLQFLVMSLGPAVSRREAALSRLSSRPRFVKLNRNALLAMDPQTQASVIKTRIDSRTLTPSEARAYYDQPPFTEQQMAEFDRLFGKGTQPAPTTATPQAGGAPS